MKISTAMATGLMVAWIASESSLAATPPPLERPSPPPCCADGVCYPNGTWGVYPTRWRRWPTEPGAMLEPTPAEPRPRDLGPDVPRYETPTPEEEDRRAPPPTRRPEGVEAAEEGDDVAPGTAPITPPTQPAQPGLNGPGPLEGPMESAPSMPWDEPTSDVDSPPAPPFVAVQSRQKAAPRPATRPRAASPTTPTVRPTPPNNDPPPPLPLALNRRPF